jgi:7-alpha-hydroxysteroid dehydrogenase
VLDLFRLDGKVAIVTGAGRGIGAGAAVALAEAGADVLIAARTEEQLTEVADAVKAAGRRVHVVAADLSHEDAIRGLAPTAQEVFGRVDIVVNNMGGSMPRALLDTSVRAMERAFHFNVSTAHALTTAAVPLMLAGGGGAVVNVSSVMGRVAGRGYAAYGTAKAAMAHYTRLAALDLSPRVRMNAIAVGSVATSALDIVLADDGMRTAMERNTPLGRIGDVQDIAAAVVYLASPASAYVTGKVLEVDGGLNRPNLDIPMPDL